MEEQICHAFPEASDLPECGKFIGHIGRAGPGLGVIALLDRLPGSSPAQPLLAVAVLFSFAAAGFFVLSAGGEPKLISYVRDNCTASPCLCAGPSMPGAYLEPRKLNATRYSVPVTGLNTDAQFRDAADDL